MKEELSKRPLEERVKEMISQIIRDNFMSSVDANTKRNNDLKKELERVINIYSTFIIYVQ